MPYAIRRVGSGYKVLEQAGGAHPGHAFSKKPQSRAKALAQRRAILANTHGK